MLGDNYHAIADRLADDIACGRLKPGERLAPQRDFAYRRGIANSTASRVYGELRRRGLVAGEVGRGTFVRAATVTPRRALDEPAAERIDLELNFPVVPDQAAWLARSLAGLVRRPTDLGASLQPIGGIDVRHTVMSMPSSATSQPVCTARASMSGLMWVRITRLAPRSGSCRAKVAKSRWNFTALSKK